MEEWRYRELYELEEPALVVRALPTVIWALVRSAGVGPAPRTLDAGCGTGRDLVESGRLGQPEGVDFSAEAVEFCRRRGLEGVQQASLEELPFEDGRFDLILSTNVIEHLDDDLRVLVELRRVAAPGARLAGGTVPPTCACGSTTTIDAPCARRYTQRRLRQQVTAAGWEPQLGTYFFTTLLPGVAAVRMLRRFRPDADGSSDLERRPQAHRLLELPSVGEAKLIERGVRLPAGVSVEWSAPRSEALQAWEAEPQEVVEHPQGPAPSPLATLRRGASGPVPPRSTSPAGGRASTSASNPKRRVSSGVKQAIAGAVNTMKPHV